MDIRKFFTRKRKQNDDDTNELKGDDGQQDVSATQQPPAKKRKLTDSECDANSPPAKKVQSLCLQEANQEAKPPQNENENTPQIANGNTPSACDDNVEVDADTEQKCVSEADDVNDRSNHKSDDDESDDAYVDNEQQSEADDDIIDDDDDEDDQIEDDDEANDMDRTTTTATDGSTKKAGACIILSKIKESQLKAAIHFDVVKNAGFQPDSRIEYHVISDLFDALSATTKRLEKTELMSRVFRSILHLKKDRDDLYESLLYTIYLCCNEIAPPYEGLELGIGDQIILKALCESTGRKLRDLKAEVTRQGDMGDVAVECRSQQNTLFPAKALTVALVFETLKRIASTSGSGTQQEKVRHIQRLFVAAKKNEARYLVRHLQGRLRIGVNEQTVLAALGRALAFDALGIINSTAGEEEDGENPKKKKKPNTKSSELQRVAQQEMTFTARLKQCVAELPNYELVVKALIKHGIGSLAQHCHLTAGVPIKAMLAKPTKGIADILKRFEAMRFTLEYKYDGERAQIHLLSDGSLRVFSRNAEDNTTKFPELVQYVQRFKRDDVSSFIIDSEIVAYDRVNDTILPFSTLMTRKRKNVNEADITVSVCVYAFDCLLLNGTPLIGEPFCRRRQNLHDKFREVTGEFQFAHHCDSNDPEQISEYLTQAVSVGKCEGLMVKTLDVEATYEPSKRSHNWLKCKKDYLDGVGDTLDLVVMGAFHGTGKRTGTFGSYLVGCYNDSDDAFQSCCKVGTGFSDDDLKTLHAEMTQCVSESKPIEYETSYECDVWFEPKCVWELKCADLTISPTHSAAIGLVHESSGIALRFPRFIRKREDKNPHSATTAQQVHEMYGNQAILQ